MSSSVEKEEPGKYSSPTSRGCIAGDAQTSRVRLKAAMATSLSAGWLSQLGLMMGASAISLDLIVTFPVDSVATRPAMIDAY